MAPEASVPPVVATRDVKDVPASVTMSPFLAVPTTLEVNANVALFPLSVIAIVSKSVFVLIEADSIFQKSVLFWFVVKVTE